MTTLRIEHSVADFDAWKRAFDGDPAGRERAGVRSYRILRPVDDRGYVMIDLEFDSADAARSLLAAMTAVWAGPARAIVSDVRTSISEQIEAKAY